VTTYNVATDIEAAVSECSAQPKIFCAAIVLVPLLTLLLAFPVSCTSWFVRRTSDYYFINLGYGLTLRNADCEVVVYGDSSALTGVDPGIASVLLFTGTGTSPNDVAAIETILGSSHLNYSTVNSFQLNWMSESQISG
jgi:hypothetical protein